MPGTTTHLTGRPYIIRSVMGFAEIPGMDFSGIVKQLGDDAEGGKFVVSDEVLGALDTFRGAFADFFGHEVNGCLVKKVGLGQMRAEGCSSLRSLPNIHFFPTLLA